MEPGKGTQRCHCLPRPSPAERADSTSQEPTVLAKVLASATAHYTNGSPIAVPFWSSVDVGKASTVRRVPKRTTHCPQRPEEALHGVQTKTCQALPSASDAGFAKRQSRKASSVRIDRNGLYGTTVLPRNSRTRIEKDLDPALYLSDYESRSARALS